MIAWSGSRGCYRLRLLAEQTGLRAGVSRAMARRGFDPVYDRGQVLIDMAVAQILGGEAISDFQGVQHLAPGDRAGGLDPHGVAGTVRGWRAAARRGQHRSEHVAAALVGAAGRPPARVPLAAGGRAGAGRDHRGRSGRLGRVRVLGQGQRAAHYKWRDRILPQSGDL